MSQNQQISAPITLKTYRNEEWGFEFGYPEDWTLHLTPDVLRGPRSKFELIGTTPKEKVPNTILPSFLVNIVTVDFADNAAISFRNLNAKISNIIITGIEGTKYEYEFASTQRITIDFSFGEHRMFLGAAKEHENVFNQIVASFKFLNR